MDRNQLQLASEKNKSHSALWILHYSAQKKIKFNLGEVDIRPVPTLKSLDMTMDRHLTLSANIQKKKSIKRQPGLPRR